MQGRSDIRSNICPCRVAWWSVRLNRCLRRTAPSSYSCSSWSSSCCNHIRHNRHSRRIRNHHSRLRYNVHHQCHIVVINKNDRGIFSAGVCMPTGKTFLKSHLTTSFFLTKTSHDINILCVRMAFLRTKHHFCPLRASERRFHARPHNRGGGTC